MHQETIEKFREALQRHRHDPRPSPRGTFLDNPNSSRISSFDEPFLTRNSSKKPMDVVGQSMEAATVLERLLTTNLDANADRTKFRFDCNIWLAPYGCNGIPRPTDLHVARAFELSPNSISFFFPLAFTKDLLAIRIGSGNAQIDVCAKITNQTTVETREFGPTNLIECRFVGKLFLG